MAHLTLKSSTAKPGSQASCPWPPVWTPDPRSCPDRPALWRVDPPEHENNMKSTASKNRPRHSDYVWIAVIFCNHTSSTRTPDDRSPDSTCAGAFENGCSLVRELAQYAGQPAVCLIQLDPAILLIHVYAVWYSRNQASADPHCHPRMTTTITSCHNRRESSWCRGNDSLKSVPWVPWLEDVPSSWPSGPSSPSSSSKI